MAKINLTGHNKNTKYHVELLCDVIDMYNRNLLKFTGGYRGRIAKPKIDKIPKKYISINEYLDSRPEWKNILKFVIESNVSDINDYIEVMMRNWNKTKTNMNINLVKPTPNILFSLKMTWVYDKYKGIELDTANRTKHLPMRSSEEFHRLTPSSQTNINSLIRLKRINSDLTYHDIVDLFRGEFKSDFVEIIKSTPDKDINEETLVKLFAYK